MYKLFDSVTDATEKKKQNRRNQGKNEEEEEEHLRCHAFVAFPNYK